MIDIAPYEISQSPFELPIVIYEVKCNLKRELQFLSRKGANLATSLRGVFRLAIHELACTNPHSTNCKDCPSYKKCLVPFLYGPRSEAQRRDLASPIILWPMEPVKPANTIKIKLVIWGRQAIQCQEIVFRALSLAGEYGIEDSVGGVPFASQVALSFDGTLNQLINSIISKHSGARRMGIEMLGPPFATSQSVRQQLNKETDISLSAILGNAAHDLVLWDVEDRGLSYLLAKQGCDKLAQMARERACAALDLIKMETTLLAVESYGKRYSRQNGKSFALNGLIGKIHLSGDIEKVLPWLVVLSLRGGTAKKSFGTTRVQLSFDS